MTSKVFLKQNTIHSKLDFWEYPWVQPRRNGPFQIQFKMYWWIDSILFLKQNVNQEYFVFRTGIRGENTEEGIRRF